MKSADSVFSKELDEHVGKLSERLPEVHHLSDCIDSVRLAGALLARILGRAIDEGSLGTTVTLAEARAQPAYSIADAEKISKKLRALARYRGVTPVLNTWGLVMRLAPELVALIDDGYSHEDVNDALLCLGVDIAPLLARR
ncbi:MAG TPA: hypothetical protein VHO06_04915 [Polyangia bacterium]|nr:hypothetical protein [Polyangia bacterium]